MIPFSLTTLKNSMYWPITDHTDRHAMTLWQQWIYPQGITGCHQSVSALAVKQWARSEGFPVIAGNSSLWQRDSESYVFAAWQLPRHQLWLLIPSSGYGDETYLELSRSVLMMSSEITGLIGSVISNAVD